eukprot:scaffold9.g3240.t1
MRSTAIDAILDEPLAEEEAPVNGAGKEDQEQRLYEEHVARVKAEAEAQASTRRLQVQQEQFAEWLQEKEADTRGLLQRAAALEALLGQLLGAGGAAAASGSAAAVAAARAELDRLREELESACAEAAANARQLREESARLVKRSSSEAQLGPAEDGDVEMKRPREGSEESLSDASPAAAAAARGAAAAGEEDEEEAGAGPRPAAAGAAAGAGAGAAASGSADSFRERAKYIPLRLTMEERRLLRLLEAALSVSEYTDKVDVLSWRSKTARVHAQIKDICAILCGLTVAQDFRRGQALIAERDFADLATFFQDCFEVGRRHKIMNPEKMRDSEWYGSGMSAFGKLVYCLMDAMEPEVAELLEFNCVRPLRTVHALLEEAGGLAMLDDPLMEVATAEIAAAGRSRAEERAREALARRYRSRALGEDDLLRCLYSISDNNSYLLFNRDPVDRMIAYLRAFFRPDAAAPGASLAIQGGSEGARLTHSHARQYAYVLQVSLTLWREISHEMFKLWCLAELQNTGQGLNRVQSAPRVGRAMQGILARCQARIGSWVGSSVVHLGDHNVPNALMFIDKYTQVPRILNPVVLVLDELPNAGSCIDGRLTSAWNWCSRVEKKPYYPLFKLAGFVGFDGEFKG